MSAGRIGRALGELGLFVLAAAGVLCIALVAAALAFNVTIMLFATGSMSPTIPAGSAALVREIPASEVHLGDVVTVDRDGRLPVTHRVVAIDVSPSGAPEGRALTLRGDANPVDDPAPYDVTTVRLVLWSVPGVAGVISALQHPVVLGILTLGLTALVLWAFWPRGPHGRRAPRRDRASAAAGDRGRVGALGGLVVLAVAGASWGAAPPAEAAPVERVVQGEYLRLTTIGDPLALARLAPGDTATLLLGASTIARAPGTITLRLEVTVHDPSPILLRVVSCDGGPAAGGCDHGREIVPERPLRDSITDLALGEIPGRPGGWLRFELRMPEQDPVPGARAEWRVQADGFGELLETDGSGGTAAGPPGGGLSASGVEAAGRALLAAGLLALGGTLALLARRRVGRAP
ncbi:hypothetical protein ROT00_14660 [Agromyces mediolanus]|uniref:hypothetical protein n=1 Tax=Agromyces mediolanus TaxID=41986 RepID=UPI0038324135